MRARVCTVLRLDMSDDPSKSISKHGEHIGPCFGMVREPFEAEPLPRLVCTTTHTQCGGGWGGVIFMGTAAALSLDDSLVGFLVDDARASVSTLSWFGALRSRARDRGPTVLLRGQWTTVHCAAVTSVSTTRV